MKRQTWFIADDYGLSPGVSQAILELAGAERLSGTGCMTVFPEWPEHARRMRNSGAPVAVGLHVTLTDQPALAGGSSLSPNGVLPPFGSLVAGIATGRIREADLHAEIDAQYARFADGMGALPAYVDGHQHIHFLPPVRRWLRRLSSEAASPLPWLRGAPARPGSGFALAAKVGIVRALAKDFDAGMRGAGYRVVGPLSGFYDWKRPEAFAPALERSLRKLPDSALFMCHPGFADETLRQRDVLVEARETEHAFLKSQRFAELLAENGMTVARP